MSEESTIGLLGVCYILIKLDENLKYRLSLSKFSNTNYTLIINPIDIDIDNIYQFADAFAKFSSIIKSPHSLTMYHTYQEAYFSSYIDIQFVINFNTDNIEMIAYDMIYDNINTYGTKSEIDIPVYGWSSSNIEEILNNRKVYSNVALSDTGNVYLVGDGDREEYVIVNYYDKDNIEINY